MKRTTRWLLCSYLLIIVVFQSICSFAAGLDNIEYDKLVTQKIYGTWVGFGGGIATTDDQEIHSLRGEEKGISLDVSLSVTVSPFIVDWIEFTGEVGLTFTESEIKLAGTTAVLNKGESVNFYYRPVYEILRITRREYLDSSKTTLVNEYTEEVVGVSIAYAWVIRDSNENTREDTRDDTLQDKTVASENPPDPTPTPTPSPTPTPTTTPSPIPTPTPSPTPTASPTPTPTLIPSPPDGLDYAIINNGSDRPKDRLNLRQGPSNGHKTMGRYYTGVYVIVREDAGEGWVKVSILGDNRTGYMKKTFLEFDTSIKIKPQTAQLQMEDAPWILYETPGQNLSVIETFDGNEIYQVLGDDIPDANGKKTWWFIRCGDSFGFIQKQEDIR